MASKGPKTRPRQGAIALVACCPVEVRGKSSEAVCSECSDNNWFLSAGDSDNNFLDTERKSWNNSGNRAGQWYSGLIVGT